MVPSRYKSRVHGSREGDPGTRRLTREGSPVTRAAMPLQPPGPPLPPLLGAVRRGRLLGADGALRTWEGWDTERGVRVFVQTGPAAMLRAVPERGGLGWSRREAPVAHLVSEAVLGLLCEREPLESGEGAQLAVPVALAGVRDLCTLHRAGGVHGAVSARTLVLVERDGRARWALGRWPGMTSGSTESGSTESGTMERGRTGTGAEQDWSALGALVGTLGDALDVETFAHWPPRDATEAWARVRATLPRELAAARHALRRRALRSTGAMARARLDTLAARLSRAAPPPACDARVETNDGRRFTLRAGADRFEVDDGARVRVVWSRDAEGTDQLDVGAARALVRAVGRSGGGGAGTPTPPARHAMRWVVAALRLHTERVVLEGTR
jgi:hypothetical protein